MSRVLLRALRRAGSRRALSGFPSPEQDAVKSYELFKVAPRWLLLRIETANGVVGWGEPNLEGFSDTVATCVGELMRSVVGEDPSRIQHVWQKICRQKFYGGGPVIMSALAGIDQALWDIAGRTLGVPVHRLLGGAVRERLAVYRWCGGDDNTPEAAAAEARAVLDGSNFKHLKMNACPRLGYLDLEPSRAVRAAADRMAAVRDAVGPDVGVGLDFHGRVKLPVAARMMAALEPFEPLFFEEPVGAAQNAALPALAARTSVPLATGERMFAAHEFRDLLAGRGVHVIQPDCSHAGGISSMLALARMAEAYEVGFAPHCPLGPIALASCMHVDACAINFTLQETSIGIHYNAEGAEGGGELLDYLVNPGVLDVDADGYVARLDGPGLGVEIDEAKVRAAAERGHDWRDREWTLPDGSPTTW